MVFFTCGGCGESLKKAQVDRHRWRCNRSGLMSCVDCHRDFHGDQYQAHTKCLTEDQKYGGSNYVAKESKGEVKQEKWINQVQRAIDALAAGDSGDRGLRSVLEQVRNFPNIPRKQQKFESFLKNSLRIRDQRLISETWAAISSAQQQQQEESTVAAITATAANGKQQQGKNENDNKRKVQEEEEEDLEQDQKKRARLDDDQHQQINNGTEQSGSKSFGWRKVIKTCLKQAPGNEMKAKKLRKLVLAQYRREFAEENGSTTTEEDGLYYEAALQKLVSKERVLVEGKIVRYVVSG